MTLDALLREQAASAPDGYAVKDRDRAMRDAALPRNRNGKVGHGAVDTLFGWMSREG